MSTTTAAAPRLIAGPDATREQWLAERRKGVTATEIAAVMGLSPWESPYSLFYRKLGELPEIEDNDAMRWGRRLESAVIAEFTERHPELHVAPGGLYAGAVRTWQLATPDGLLYADGATQAPIAGLEVKTAGSYDGWGDEGTDDIPLQYRCQALWQLDVLGVDEVRFAVLFTHARKYREYLVQRDEDDLTLMRTAGSDFLDQLATGVPPAVDWRPETAKALKNLHPGLVDVAVEVPVDVADEYDEARAAAKVADERKQLAENRLRELIGDGKTAVCGDRKVASRSVYDQTRIDTDRLAREFPDAYAACSKTTTVNKLNPARRAS